MDTPTTLLEAVRHFSDADNCERAMRNARWPGGKPRCPECQSTNIGEIKTRRLLRCRDCRRTWSWRTGTIMEDSALPLSAWLSAIWAEANGGASSTMLAETLGIQQKSAWRMTVMIRAAMEIA